MTLRTGTAFWTALLFAASGTGVAGADAPAATAPATAAAPSGQDRYTNAVAAVVNGKVITMTELSKECKTPLDKLFEELKMRYPTETEAGAIAAEREMKRRGDEIGRDTLHSMVDRTLIVEDFRSRGGSFPQSYLDWQFDDEITTTFQGDREKFLRFLQERSITEADYRRQLEERDIVDAMMQQLHSSVTGISPDRIKSYYEKHKEDFRDKDAIMVRRITLNLTPVADATPELFLQQAAKIVQEARQPGANFTDLAKQHSTEFSRGRDLPVYTFYRNDQALAPALQEAVFKLKPGEVSDPLVSDKVIFIFKCEDRTVEGYRPLDKVRPTIERLLEAENWHVAWDKWLQKLRSKAYILYNVYRTPEDAAGK